MRTAMVRLTLVITLLASCGSAPSQSAPSAGMQEDIRRLMEVSGAGNLAVQVMNQMLSPIKRAMPKVPEEFWTKFMAKVDTDELIDVTIPIYAKYFTPDEIKQLLAFYQTPLGQKVIATLPAVMQESMVAGQKWGQQLVPRLFDELKAEGHQ